MYVCILYKLYIYVCVLSLSICVCVSLSYGSEVIRVPLKATQSVQEIQRGSEGNPLIMFPTFFFSRDLDFFPGNFDFFQYISSPAWAEVGVVEASVVHSHGEVDQVQIQVLHTQVIA